MNPFFDTKPHSDKSIYAGQPKNPPAFCHCPIHRGMITVKEMKRKECLKKQCPYLERYESHEYWHQRKLTKEKRKNRQQSFMERVNQFGL